MPQVQSRESLEQILADNSCLSSRLSTELPDGFSNAATQRGDDLTQPRCFWLPAELPGSKSVFLASSRLDRQLEDKPEWFDALRTFACHANSSDNFLITADGVASDEFVTRVAELFRIPLVRFVPFPDRIDKTWVRQANEIHGPREFVCYYSMFDRERREKKAAQAAKDRLLILAASQVRLLACRKAGNTFNAANERLAAGLDTRILIENKLTQPATTAHLVHAGAIAWLLINDEEERPHPTARKMNVSILRLDEINSQRYLLHWTRRRIGKWPDQTKSQYLDDLIFGATQARHDPLAALCRILATDQIVATNDLTRDPTPVVCLSQVALSRLGELTVFRPHLSRWDFLPYGIAIDKERLTRLGARPVTYGEASDWNKLNPSERPFFQIASSGSGKIDWREEKEWRLVGTLDLKKIAHDDAVVFVPTHADAEAVSSLSRWPVVVLANEAANKNRH